MKSLQVWANFFALEVDLSCNNILSSRQFYSFRKTYSVRRRLTTVCCSTRLFQDCEINLSRNGAVSS